MKNSRIPSLLSEKLTTAQVLLLVGSACLFLLLRWNSISVPFERDEGEYAYSAWQMRQHVMPYENAFIQKPPMIIYMYILGQFISEDSYLPPRIIASLFLYLAIVATGIIVAKERGNSIGLLAIWLMIPMFSVPVLASFAANTEVFMSLPMVCLLLLYRWKRWQATGIHWLAGGCCSALACLFKPIAVPVVLFILVVWFIESWKSGNRPALLKMSVPLVVLGGVGTTLVFVSPFLIYDGGKTLWECVVQYNMQYANAYSGGSRFIFYLTVLWGDWWILFMLMGWYIIKRPEQWWFYIGLLVISLLTIFRTPQGHYYIMIIPYIAIIVAISLDVIFISVRNTVKQLMSPIKIAVASLLVLYLVFQHSGLSFKSSPEFIKELYADNPFTEAPTVAEKVAALSKPDDYVFIAGSEPEVLYYAKRKSSSRFVIMYPLMIPTPVAMRYQEETVRSLEENPPEVLVFVRAGTSWLRQRKSPILLWDYVNQVLSSSYRLVGGTLYDGKKWIDNPDEEQYRNCSMVVFKKIQTGERK